MSVRVSRAAMVLLVIGACGGDPGAPAAETDRWADSMVPVGAVPGLENDEEGEDDEDGDEGDERFWVGYGEPVPGQAFTGAGELAIGNGAIEVCIVLFRYVASTPLDDCSGCEFAYELTLGDIEVELDAGCREAGVDPATLDGMTHTIGYAGEEYLLVKVGDTWIVGGEVYSEEHEFEFEMPFAPLEPEAGS